MKVIDKPKQTHNGRTVAQQARFMLQRMTPQAAVNAAFRYTADAGEQTPTGDWWSHVAILLGNHKRGETSMEIINAMAMADDNGNPPLKTHAERQAIPKLTTTPEVAAPAQPDALVKTLVKVMRIKHDHAASTVEQFKLRLTDDAANALEWSQSVFEAAARVRVFGQVLAAILDSDGNPKVVIGDDKRDTVEWIREYAAEEVMRKSRYSSQERSTSFTANLMEREYLAAWADVVEIIKWRV